ncbi:hypothetical protein [Promicromonospora soli]
MTVAVLVALLIAVGLLRLVGVCKAWAALGLAVVLVALAGGIYYVADEGWRGDEEQWDILILMVAALASIVTFLAYAGGLLVGDLRDRRARNRAAGDRVASPVD